MRSTFAGCKGAGIDMDEAEVEAKLKELNGGGAREGCDFETFTRFMLAQLETGEGAAAVEGAFAALAGGAEAGGGAITAAAVDRLFGARGDGGELAQYLHEHMAVSEAAEGYDYKLFTKQLFSC